MAKTVKQILNLEPDELMKMKRSELAEVTSLLSRAANKRIKRLEAKDIDTPALQGYERSGGKFGTRGKNLNELRSEFYRVSHFLNAKTSTITGAKQVHKEVVDRLTADLTTEEREKYNLTTDQLKDFWEGYRKLQEVEPAQLKEYGSAQMQEYLRKQFDDIGVQTDEDIDEMIQRGLEKLDIEYEEREDEVYDMGEFFEI